MLALDIDPRNGGGETLKGLIAELGELPTTVTSKTGGGGLHLLFSYPRHRVRKDSAGKLLGPGIDVLSDASIMIAPPSRHVTGNQYKWEIEKSWRDIKPAVIPANWLARLAGEPEAKSASTTISTISEGSRNTSLTSLAGSMKASGASHDAIVAALLAQNETKCSPPLAEAEVRKIAKSVSKYPDPDRSDDAERLLQVLLSTHFHGGKHLIFGADGRFWYYSGAVWSPAPDKWIDGRILDSIKTSGIRTSQRSAPLMKQVRLLLEAQLASMTDPFAFVSEPPRVINCKNGEIWISDDGEIELRSHRPKSYLRHILDVEYKPEAKCPQYQKALLDIFAKTKKPKQMRRHWNELLGYLIQPNRDQAKIVVMLGGGNNGKTKLMRTVVKLLGLAQVHAQRVDELDRNRFAIGSLLGKLVFIDDDVKAGTRLPDGTLKMISEAKEVTGENKYKPPFQFVVRTVPLLLCNNVPSLADVSHGMMRRLMVIRLTGHLRMRMGTTACSTVSGNRSYPACSTGRSMAMYAF